MIVPSYENFVVLKVKEFNIKPDRNSTNSYILYYGTMYLKFTFNGLQSSQVDWFRITFSKVM